MHPYEILSPDINVCIEIGSPSDGVINYNIAIG